MRARSVPGACVSRSGKIKVRRWNASNLVLVVVAVVLVALTVFTFVRMDYGKNPLGECLRAAVGNFATMVTTPRLDGHFTAEDIASGLLVTLGLSVLTTLVSAVIALLLGLIAAVNLSNMVVSNAVKVVMSVIRAVPTILWVLVFTVSIGLGAEAAVVGMMFHSIGYLVKAYSESFEEVDPGVIEALKATGATWWQVVTQGVLLEKVNELLSWTFIRFEINFVAAVVVAGMAGSGGIGYELFLAGNYYFNIHEIGLIVYLCLAVSVVLEVIATKLRKRFIVQR